MEATRAGIHAEIQRFTIPYPSWKAAFKVCIGDSPATPVYKLLQSKQCLQEKLLKIIERLGHSVDAYAATKDCLDRKYEGEQSLISINLTKLEKL